MMTRQQLAIDVVEALAPESPWWCQCGCRTWTIGGDMLCLGCGWKESIADAISIDKLGSITSVFAIGCPVTKMYPGDTLNLTTATNKLTFHAE